MKGLRRIAWTLILAAALHGCADNDTVTPGTPAETVSVAFQDGAHPYLGYNGTRDAVIKDGPGSEFWLACFGTESVDTVGMANLAGAWYERRLLVKMDLSGITDCDAVLSATLSVRLEAPQDSIELCLLRISHPGTGMWVEGTTGGVGVSWTTLDGAEPWLQSGGDADTTVLDRVTVAGDTTVKFDLPRRVVDGWIVQPAENDGVMIRICHPYSLRSARVHMRESILAADRPRMDILYLSGG